jgi:hypothetical protein
MRSLVAVFSALLLWGMVGAAFADQRVGEVQAIDVAEGIIRVDNADFELNGYDPSGVQVGDRVRVEYIQEDIHDPFTVRTITKLETGR